MSTIISMSDKYGVTGNADFKDGRMPTDADLLAIAEHYRISEEIKVTITDAVGSKTKFQINIRDGEVVKLGKPKVNMTAINNVRKMLAEDTIEKLKPFMNVNYNNAQLLDILSIREEDIWQEVQRRRLTTWAPMPDKYLSAMFNYVVAEYAIDKYGSI